MAGRLVQCSGGLVVMASVLHTEGREFNPRSEYFFFARPMASWGAAVASSPSLSFLDKHETKNSEVPFW